MTRKKNLTPVILQVLREHPDGLSAPQVFRALKAQDFQTTENSVASSLSQMPQKQLVRRVYGRRCECCCRKLTTYKILGGNAA